MVPVITCRTRAVHVSARVSAAHSAAAVAVALDQPFSAAAVLLLPPPCRAWWRASVRAHHPQRACKPTTACPRRSASCSSGGAATSSSSPTAGVRPGRRRPLRCGLPLPPILSQQPPRRRLVSSAAGPGSGNGCRPLPSLTETASTRPRTCAAHITSTCPRLQYGISTRTRRRFGRANGHRRSGRSSGASSTRPATRSFTLCTCRARVHRSTVHRSPPHIKHLPSSSPTRATSPLRRSLLTAPFLTRPHLSTRPRPITCPPRSGRLSRRRRLSLPPHTCPHSHNRARGPQTNTAAQVACRSTSTRRLKSTRSADTKRQTGYLQSSSSLVERGGRETAFVRDTTWSKRVATPVVQQMRYSISRPPRPPFSLQTPRLQPARFGQDHPRPCTPPPSQ